MRPIAWLATIPQLLTLTIATVAGWVYFRSNLGIVLGAGAYLAYSFASREFVTSAHRQGIRLTRNGQFEDAVRAYQESYDFFQRHIWIDHFRAIVLMSPSAISYREMALINIAFCHSQVGAGKLAEQYYRRALDEFPESAMAAAALRRIESVQSASS